MEEKNKLNNYKEEFELIRQSIAKNEIEIKENRKRIEENEKMIEENGKMLEQTKKEIKENGKRIENFEKTFRKSVAEIEKEINELRINISFINNIFLDFLQNTNNNNDKNEILKGLEEVELNEKFKNKEEIKCTICLENYAIGDKISYLPCIHFFHSSCIKNWIRIKNKCPICNTIIKFS